MRTSFLAIALISITWAAGSCAYATQFESGDAVLLSKGKTVDDDIVGAGSQLTIESQVNGDVALAGWTVIVSGPVKDSVMLAGNQVAVSGSVGNDAWCAGSLVELSSSVADNAYLCGSTVAVTRNASVGKDLMVAGGDLGIAGTVGRDLRVAGNIVNIAGTVNGNVYATAQRLRIAKGALIKGSLYYESPGAAIVDPQAKIVGQTKHTLPKVEKARPVFWSKFAWWFGQFVAAILFGAMLLILFPTRTLDTAEGVRQSFWSSLGVGLLIMVAAPIVLVILGITVVGLPLAIATFLIYMVLLYASFIITAIALGQGVLARAGSTSSKPVGSMILGLAILALVCLIPVAGCLIALGAVAAGLGAFLSRWWRSTRRVRIVEPTGS